MQPNNERRRLQQPLNSHVRIFIVADDLTGACDVAAPFAMCGEKVEVQITSKQPHPSTTVVAINTESRDTPESTSLLKLDATLRRLPFSADTTVLKKVDSLCRGNTFFEIRAISSRFPEHLIFFAPSYPSLGRSVTSGYLHLDSMSGNDLNIAECLDSKHIAHSILPECIDSEAKMVHIQSAINNGTRFFLCDASTDAGMRSIVQAALSLNRRLIWIGSGGLAHAIANTCCDKRSTAPCWTPRNETFLLCIGSDHITTKRQIEHAIHYINDIICIEKIKYDTEAFSSHLKNRKPIIWSIDPELNIAAIRDTLIQASNYSRTTVLLSGGDTAAKVCNAMEVQSIFIAGELLPGIPWGIISGGKFDGMRIITKSGAFGKADALTRITQLCHSSCLVNEERE